MRLGFTHFLLVCAFASLAEAQTPIWRLLPNSPPQPSVARHDDVYFVSPSRGWVVNGAGKIYRTTNGGASWETQLSLSSTYIRSVAFADSLHGWAGTLVQARLLYATTDGGLNWNQVLNIPNPLPTGICGLWTVEDSVVYGSGKYSGPASVIKSTDLGATWTTLDMSAYASALVDCYFFTRDSGFVIGARGPGALTTDSLVVLATTDGGQSWSTRFLGTRAGELGWKIVFPTPSTGYVSIEAFTGTSRYLLKTTDRGWSWIEEQFIDEYDAQGIGFATETKGWIGGWTGSTYETTDGGWSWHSAVVGSLINSFHMLSDTLGYAVGRRVYKFSSDSTTVAVLAPFTLPGQTTLEQNYPNPFNPETHFRFRLGIVGIVSLRVYDILGRVVAEVMREAKPAGSYDIPWDASGLTSGVYYYRLRVGDFDMTRKLVLVR